MNNLNSDSFTGIKWKLVGNIGKILIDIICGTVKVEAVGFEKIRPIIVTDKFIFAVWHSRIFLLAHLFKGIRASILVSKSKDGEIISRILQNGLLILVILRYIILNILNELLVLLFISCKKGSKDSKVLVIRC